MKPDTTVIHGTMRPQDLIPAFLGTLQEVDHAAHSQLMLLPFGPIPAYVQDEGDESEWWNGDDAAFLLESLFDALNAAAPENCYFGAHPGDGSDFGFWRIED